MELGGEILAEFRAAPWALAVVVRACGGAKTDVCVCWMSVDEPIGRRFEYRHRKDGAKFLADGEGVCAIAPFRAHEARS